MKNKKIIGIVVIFVLVVVAMWFGMPAKSQKVANVENHTQNENEVRVQNETVQSSINTTNSAKENREESKVAPEKIVNNEKVVVVTIDNFEEEVLKSKKLVLLEFYADWCKPCRNLAPTIDEIAIEQNNIKVCKINTDEAQDLKAQYEIKAVPTIVCIKSGEEINRAVEIREKSEILEILEP